jgi:hypothetical protein
VDVQAIHRLLEVGKAFRGVVLMAVEDEGKIPIESQQCFQNLFDLVEVFGDVGRSH